MDILTRINKDRSIEYYRAYYWRNSPNCGFEFKCDRTGLVDTSYMTRREMSDYEKCLTGVYDVIDVGIKKYPAL